MGQEEYISRTRRLDFYNVCIRETIMPIDHRMILGELIVEGFRRHCWYFKERDTWPITASKGGMGKEGDLQFNDLKQRVKKPPRK